ncbi:MAG: serine--tRNA ligase [Anaerolineaceae bacterium]|nr:serine--tRNA ligase [Anaerolineaceae bacterium]
MFDINLIRDEPQTVLAGLKRRGEACDIAAIRELDHRRRSLVTERDELRKRRNTVSKEVGRIKSGGGEATEQMAESKAIGQRIKEIEEQLKDIGRSLGEALLRLPNLPAGDVPEGAGPEDNQTLKTVGRPAKLSFPPLPHWELCEKLGILDLQRGAKIAGSGFPVFVGQGAQLVRAMVSWMLDVQTKENGYTEVFPPVLVNPKTMTGTGQLPKFEEELYKLRDDDLYLIPTAEVPVTNLYRDEILTEADLPLLHAAYTLCFRRESGAAGRETRGMIRVHQFNKVEMVKFTTPETSDREHEALTVNAEDLLERLGLAYRRVLLCAGDMSFAARKCYDLEVYSAGCDRWLEVSSCSNFGDFQARRANIRYRTESGKVRFVHTLNGSGLALPRIFVSIVENFQQADGTVRIPDVLQPYMGGREFIGK